MALPKPLSRALLVLPLLAIVALAWAFFWPDRTCSEPACARKRFSLFIELDSFRGIDPVPLEVATPNETVSLRSILRSGGIDVTIELDDDALPYSPESGPLDRADLYQYALAWRNKAAPSHVDGQIYAMMTPALVSDRGERLFGIMFDGAGREGVAVAPRETERTFGKAEPESIPLLQLRTFVHEILHALNRRHLDAAQMSDGRITLEAPTRCLVDRKDSQWHLTEPPLMRLSPSTIQFFQTAEPRDVLPGGANTPFEGMRSSATECDEVRARSSSVGSDSRFDFAKQRLLSLIGIQSAGAQELDETETIEIAPSVTIRVQAQQAAYPLGYPIALRLMVHNRSAEALPLRDRLSPAFGIVQIEYRFKDDQDWQAYRPLAWYEPADEEQAMLAPDAYHEQTTAIYFGEGGWTFSRAGEYEVRATLRISDELDDIASNVIPIRIGAPATEDEQAVLEPLLDSEGSLDTGIGRLLMFGGRIGDTQAQAPLEEVVHQHADTALGSALRLTLASQRLSPPIDPLTGERGQPKFADARVLLSDACTDSGIAALKYDLLTRFEDEIPPSMQADTQSSAEAWDGLTARRTVIPTYSDPRLQASSASLHFCFNDTSLGGEPRRAASRIAQGLARAKPSRIVVVGHADATGTCRFNDALALRRAQTVRSFLISAGLPRAQIEAVTLGERRPADFGTSEEARLLNRRVEVLYELPEEDADDLAQRLETNGAEDVEEPEATIERALPRC